MQENVKFDYAMRVILMHEGGLIDNKADPGGITNYGISLRYLKSQGIDIDGNGDSDSDDIKHLDKDEAKSIYKREWWDKYKYNEIESVIIATKIFDMAVNMGAITAHKLVQKALNIIVDRNIVEDGILGPVSFNLINTIDIDWLLDEIQVAQENYYKKLVAEHPKLAVFLKGWMARAMWPD
jgi:lysozyme family protein